MQWLLLVFGVVGVCGTICMKLSDGGAWGSVSFMYHGGTGCDYMRRFDLCCGFIVSLLRCGSEMRGMKTLCTGSVLKFRV